MKKMYSALIVGCGKIAGGEQSVGLETHAGAIFSESRIVLNSCVDLDVKQARKFANNHHCKAYDNLILALEENDIHLVSVCTPDATHFSITKEILCSSRPPRVIFLEKPACKTEEEFHELKRLAKQRNVLIVVNHSRRFNVKYQVLRELITTEQLGSIYRVSATYYSGWFHNGTHIVDTLSFLMDDTIEWEQVNNVVASPYQSDPTLEMTGYLSKSRARVVISAIDESLYQLFDFDVWCQYGRLRIEDFGSRIMLERQVTNLIGERVLEESTIELPIDEKTEMQNAIGQICDYLDTNNQDTLMPVLIESIEMTMKVLWDGLALHEQLS